MQECLEVLNGWGLLVGFKERLQRLQFEIEQPVMTKCRADTRQQIIGEEPTASQTCSIAVPNIQTANMLKKMWANPPCMN